ncbi:GmrSD restriction endonuclease domain-containing protein [Pseudomonas asiatica]
MENGQKKLKELFDGRKIFSIPDYQRAYAWETTRQLPDFIEDIDNQAIGRDYFLGTILFQEKLEKNAGFDLIDIVDGQQRITTTIIFMKSLLSSLRQRLNDSQYEELGLDLVEETYILNKNRPKLQAISPDNDFFFNYILNDGNGSDHIETPSQRRLLEAKKFFHDELADRSTEELLQLKCKIDEHTKVLTYSVKDAAEATLIFETTNDRGKKLTNLEKIKSFLMYKTYLAAADDVDHYLTVIQQRFADIFRELELFDGKIDEDSILRFHYIAFEDWIDKSEYQQPTTSIRTKLNPLIAGNRKQEALAFIDRFSRELKESFHLMRHISLSKCQAFRDLACLERMESFYPLILKAFKIDPSADKKNFSITCRLLEIYSFRVFAVQQNRANTGQSALYKLARNFAGRFEPLFDNLSSIINDASSRRRFLETLQDAELYNWMSSRDLCYLVWKYENHLRRSEQPICSEMSEAEFRNTGSKTRLTVEHIASQTKNSIVLDSSIMPDIDTAFRDQHLHCLGNLTFDPASANSSKSNGEIEIKHSKYFSKAPYKTQNELESFMIEAKWTSESIDLRQTKIIDFCIRYWNPQYVSY